MLKQLVLAVLMVLAGGLLLPDDGDETVGGLTIGGVPFIGVTVEARRAVFRGCSGGYVEATRTGWVRTRNGMKRGTVRYCKKPPAPRCSWNETLHWRSGWVCVARPNRGNGIPGSKSDGFSKPPKKSGPPSGMRTCPDGRQVPYGKACGRNDLLISFHVTRPTGI